MDSYHGLKEYDIDRSYKWVNEECKEMAFVMEGSGKLEVEGKSFDLKKGDLVLIEPGKRFFWKGNMKMFMLVLPPSIPSSTSM